MMAPNLPAAIVRVVAMLLIAGLIGRGAWELMKLGWTLLGFAP